MSSNRASSGVNGGGGGGGGIPPASRKMVQSLKEIVNCPDHEIYAMLKECNMDPNDTVHRLLSQDPFHEVKSKREKKKENKDSSEPRSRGASSTSNRGGRSGVERYGGRSSATQFGSSAYKKENGTNAYTTSSYASGMAGSNTNRRPPHSDSVTREYKAPTLSTSDGLSSFSQPSSGFQPAWQGVPGQVSMADIVRMGRPQNKATPNLSHHNANHHNILAPPSSTHYDLHSSHDHGMNVSDPNLKPGVPISQHAPPNDDWPEIEHPPATAAAASSSFLESHAASELYADPYNQHLKSPDEVHVEEEEDDDDEDHVESASVSSGKVHEDNSAGASLYDNDVYNDMGSYQPHRHVFDHHEVEDVGVSVSSVAANLQQLGLHKEDRGSLPEEENPSVIIPDHLQVQSADCSHLSFGSFGSGISSSFSGPFAARSIKNNVEDAPTTADSSSVGNSDSRNPEYYGEEHLRTTSDGNLAHRTGASVVGYESPSVSQPEVLKQETHEAVPGNQYTFPSPTPGYNFEDAQQLNAAFSHAQTNSQIQNLAPFSSVMQAYSNSLPNTLLASNVQPIRDSDPSYSPFPATQSMHTKYSNNAVSSVSGSTIPMPEGLKTGNYSTPQSTQQQQQSLPNSSIATGPALPQHLAVHPYSQPTLPLGPFTNMIGYPFMPAQSYTYMPSAFQQAFGPGNSTYHQSLAAMLPQYKNSVSVSSLPQSAAIASGYGAFGSSTSIPGNFTLNPPTAPAGSTLNYEDVISSQYKDAANHLVSLPQNENSAMWVQGPGSRTMSAVPPNTYYGFQGQNQQSGGYRQAQQPSQHYGTLGYPNFYHSQTGISLEHQQQNTRDAALNASQGQQPSKQSQQLWQNSY